MRHRVRYSILTIGGGIGLSAAFLEMLEYLALLKNPNAALACNLNRIFSCTNVLNSWQSSVFGFPNVLMCLVFFTLLLGAGLVGLTGGNVGRGFRLTAHGLALFFLGFGAWYLEQSTFSIRALCILCLLCYVGLLLINGALLRLNAAGLPIGQCARAALARLIGRSADVFLWLLIALLLGFMMLLQFR